MKNVHPVCLAGIRTSRNGFCPQCMLLQNFFYFPPPGGSSNNSTKSATIEMYVGSSYNDTISGETMSSVSEKSGSYISGNHLRPHHHHHHHHHAVPSYHRNVEEDEEEDDFEVILTHWSHRQLTLVCCWHCRTTSHSSTSHPMNRARWWILLLRYSMIPMCSDLAIYYFKREG